MGNDLIKLDDKKSIAEFLQQPATKMVEFITGFLVSDANDYKLSAGHLVQATLKWKLFSQLGREIKQYIEKGKIKKDFLDTPLSHKSFCELLQFIDNEVPDEERFIAMKELFFRSVSCDSEESRRILAYHFMQVCKEISSSELLIIKACYEICNGKISKDVSSDPTHFALDISDPDNWFICVAKQIGFGIASLVEMREDNLIRLKIISDRRHSDRSGFKKTKYFRLTDLGYKLAEYLYEKHEE